MERGRPEERGKERGMTPWHNPKKVTQAPMTPDIKQKKEYIIRPERRNVLKLLLAGGGMVALGGAAGYLTSLFSESGKITETVFDNFRVKETKRELTLTNTDGDTILVVDK